MFRWAGGGRDDDLWPSGDKLLWALSSAAPLRLLAPPCSALTTTPPGLTTSLSTFWGPARSWITSLCLRSTNPTVVLWMPTPAEKDHTNMFLIKVLDQPITNSQLWLFKVISSDGSGRWLMWVVVLQGARLSVALVSSSSIRALIMGVREQDASLRPASHCPPLCSWCLGWGRDCSHSGGDAHLQKEISLNRLKSSLTLIEKMIDNNKKPTSSCHRLETCPQSFQLLMTDQLLENVTSCGHLIG